MDAVLFRTSMSACNDLLPFNFVFRVWLFFHLLLTCTDICWKLDFRCIIISLSYPLHVNICVALTMCIELSNSHDNIIQSVYIITVDMITEQSYQKTIYLLVTYFRLLALNSVFDTKRHMSRDIYISINKGNVCKLWCSGCRCGGHLIILCYSTSLLVWACLWKCEIDITVC
jgi:hypothetical protein